MDFISSIINQSAPKNDTSAKQPQKNANSAAALMKPANNGKKLIPSSSQQGISMREVEQLKKKLATSAKPTKAYGKKSTDRSDIKKPQYSSENKSDSFTKDKPQHGHSKSVVATQSGQSRGHSMQQPSKSHQHEEVKKELTEEDKQRIVQMLKLNENIGYLHAVRTNRDTLEQQNHEITPVKQEIEEYDPLEPKSFRYSKQPEVPSHQQRQTAADLNAIIANKTRKEMGQSTNVEEIEAQIERARREEKRRQQIEELHEEQESQLIRRSEKTHHKQIKEQKIRNDVNTAKKDRNDKDKKIEELQNKIQELEKQKKIDELQKQLKELKASQHSERKRDEKQREKDEIPVREKHSSNQKILMKYDDESRQILPQINVVNIREPHKMNGNGIRVQLTDKKHTSQREEHHKIRPSEHSNRTPHPPRQLNILKGQVPKKRRYEEEDYDDEEESNLSGFIVSDDEEDEENEIARKQLQKIKSRYGPREQHSYQSGDSDMEARYEDIEQEEKRATKLAKKEDAEQLRLIEMEEEEERRRKREKKRGQRH